MKLPRLYPIVDVGTLAARGIEVAAFARELVEGGAEILQLRNKDGAPAEILQQAAAIDAAVVGFSCVRVMNDRADLAVLAGWHAVHVGHKDMPVEAVRRVLESVGGGVGESRFPVRGMTTRKAMAEAAAKRKTVAETAATSKAMVEAASAEEAMAEAEAMADVAAVPAEVAVALTANATGAKDAKDRNGGVVVGVSTHSEEQVRVAEASGADYVAIGPVFGTATKVDAEPVVGLEGVRRARALTRKPLVAIGGISRENAASVIEAGADSVAVIGGLLSAERSVAEVVQDFLRRLR